MGKPTLSVMLDSALETLMQDRDASPPVLPPRLTALLRIASDLRDLPRERFKAQLGATLAAAALGRPDAAALRQFGPPLITAADIAHRSEEIGRGPSLLAYDLRAALRDSPDQTMRFFTLMNECVLGVSRGAELCHWERHPAGDELLYFLEGDAEITVLTDDGPVRSSVHAGSLFVCPQGLWHQVRPRSPIAILFATPGEGTEATAATEADPRVHRPIERASARRRAMARRLEAYDLGTVLRALPELAITRRTTAAQAMAAVRHITTLNQCQLGVMRFSGLTPWERHPDGDELLQVLEGEIDVTVLAERGPVHVTVPAGSAFVCPRGLWHRQLPRPRVTELYATPAATTEISWKEEPRSGERG